MVNNIYSLFICLFCLPSSLQIICYNTVLFKWAVMNLNISPTRRYIYSSNHVFLLVCGLIYPTNSQLNTHNTLEVTYPICGRLGVCIPTYSYSESRNFCALFLLKAHSKTNGDFSTHKAFLEGWCIRDKYLLIIFSQKPFTSFNLKRKEKFCWNSTPMQAIVQGK